MWCAFVRRRHPRRPAAPIAGGVHPRQPGRPGSATARAWAGPWRADTGLLGARAGLTSCPPWPRAGRAGGVRQPRRRARRAGPRCTGARCPGRPGHRAAHQQGPCGVRAQRASTASGGPHSVFTPHRNAWLASGRNDLHPHPVAPHADALAPLATSDGVPSLGAAGSASERTNLHALKMPTAAPPAHELL